MKNINFKCGILYIKKYGFCENMIKSLLLQNHLIEFNDYKREMCEFSPLLAQ